MHTHAQIFVTYCDQIGLKDSKIKARTFKKAFDGKYVGG